MATVEEIRYLLGVWPRHESPDWDGTDCPCEDCEAERNGIALMGDPRNEYGKGWS
jgi:hypothetical protein